MRVMSILCLLVVLMSVVNPQEVVDLQEGVVVDDSSSGSSLVLLKGKNMVFIDEYFPSYPVSVILALNPTMQSVTVEEYGSVFGFVNVFGGVGTDFLFQPGKQYEVYVSDDSVLVLPY